MTFQETTRICCHCGALIIISLDSDHHDLVIRRGCPECENLTKLRPVIVHQPHWLVDGSPEPVHA